MNIMSSSTKHTSSSISITSNDTSTCSQNQQGNRKSTRTKKQRDVINISGFSRKQMDKSFKFNQMVESRLQFDNTVCTLEVAGRELWNLSQRYHKNQKFLDKFNHKEGNWAFYLKSIGTGKEVKKNGIRLIHYAVGYEELGKMVMKFTDDISKWPVLDKQEATPRHPAAIITSSSSLVSSDDDLDDNDYELFNYSPFKKVKRKEAHEFSTSSSSSRFKSTNPETTRKNQKSNLKVAGLLEINDNDNNGGYGEDKARMRNKNKTITDDIFLTIEDCDDATVEMNNDNDSESNEDTTQNNDYDGGEETNSNKKKSVTLVRIEGLENSMFGEKQHGSYLDRIKKLEEVAFGEDAGQNNNRLGICKRLAELERFL